MHFYCISNFKGQENPEKIIIPIEVNITKNENADKEWLLQEVLKHSLLPEGEYPQNTTSFFKYVDTTIVAEKISGSRIELPCRKETVILEDMPEDEYGYYSIYKYIGRIDAINAYMVHAEYTETSGYQLIDRDSGETLFYCNLLEFSPDGRYLISGDYEGVNIDRFDLFIYAIDNKKTSQLAFLYYNDWIYAGNGLKNVLWNVGDNIYIRLYIQ